MVKIRLTRLGKHKDPFYRIVATDSRNKRDGGFIAIVGTFEPFSGKTLIDSEKTIQLLKQGAQPTNTVLNMFKENGVWAEFLKTKKVDKKAKPRKQSKKIKASKAAKKAKKAAAKKAAVSAPKKAPVEQPKQEAAVEQPKAEESAK